MIVINGAFSTKNNEITTLNQNIFSSLFYNKIHTKIRLYIFVSVFKFLTKYVHSNFLIRVKQKT